MTDQPTHPGGLPHGAQEFVPMPDGGPASGAVPSFPVANVPPAPQAPAPQNPVPQAPAAWQQPPVAAWNPTPQAPPQPTPPAYGAPAPAPYGAPVPAPVAPTVPGQPVGFRAPSVPPPALSGAPEQASASRVFAAIGAGIVVGLLAAFVYAVITSMAKAEYMMLVVAIGAAVGFTVMRIMGRPSPVTGLISAVLTLGSLLVAAVLSVEFLGAGSIADGLDRLTRADIPTVLRVYFTDPLGYVWMAASVVFGYIGGASHRFAKS